MPPKKKQTGKNGFFYFMQDFKKKQGRNFKSMQEVAEAAGPHWSKMSKEQRRPYDEMALMEKNHLRASKLTSDGLDVDEIEMEAKKEQERLQAMRDEIGFKLQVASRSGRIHKEMFFIIHVNIFCYHSSQNQYYPAEIGIAGFSLDEGVRPDYIFHRIIKPGPLPLGYACEARMHSKETHQLPPPMCDDSDYNVDQVYKDMKEFLSEFSEQSGQYPILYTEEKMMKMVQQVLDTMSYEFGHEENLFKVYNLQHMFRVLRNTVSDGTIWPSETFSVREIEKDVNSHAKGISCEFHENSNVSFQCSRSVAVRYAYTICDNCCPDLQIPLVPGRHIPGNSHIPEYRSSSMLSLDSQYSSTIKPTTREDDYDSRSVVSVSSKSEWDNQSVTSESNFGSSNYYPPLGRRGGGGGGGDSSCNSLRTYNVDSNRSNSSARSYAGVMGPSGVSRKPAAIPSSLCDRFDNFSIGDTSSENSFSTDYPALGGKRTRKPRK